MAKNINCVWALIVCYRPEPDTLLRLVRSISPQVSLIRILNNGGLSAGLRENLQMVDNVTIDDFESNVGIGSALNFGFNLAEQSSIEFVVTFDQDSLPSDRHVETLVSHWRTLSKSEVHKKTGALGPSFYDARNKIFQYPFYRVNGLGVEKIYRQDGVDIVTVDSLITSGMLVPVSMWSEGFKFKDEYFIEYVDTEWCSRTKDHGFQHYGCFDVSMQHELSDKSAKKILGLIILKYSPLRRYYYFRNSVFFIRCSYVPFAFKFRVFCGLFIRLLVIPFVDDNPIASLKNAVVGLFHAFVSGKSGKLVE
jgi:rhamnosyltransferase